jgi:hypothetical protein
MVEKRWSQLFSIMTEDDSGHVRAAEEKELNAMWVEDFFVKLLVFKERMDERKAAIDNLKNKRNG